MKTSILNKIEKLEAKIRKQKIGTIEELKEYTRLFKKWTNLAKKSPILKPLQTKGKMPVAHRTVKKNKRGNMDKRKFIYKLSNIISKFEPFTTITISYIDKIIIFKFTRTNSVIKPKKYRKLWMIEKAFTINEFIDLSQEYIEKVLKRKLFKLYSF